MSVDITDEWQRLPIVERLDRILAAPDLRVLAIDLQIVNNVLQTHRDVNAHNWIRCW